MGILVGLFDAIHHHYTLGRAASRGPKTVSSSATSGRRIYPGLRLELRREGVCVINLKRPRSRPLFEYATSLLTDLT